MQSITSRFMIAAMLTLASASIASAAEVKIAPDKLPKAVADTLTARFPGATLTDASKDSDNGEVVFDVELKFKDRKYETDIKEDGTMLELEKELAIKDLPSAVAKGVESKYPKSTIREVMEVDKVKHKEEKLDHYEVTIETSNKKKIDLTASLDGKKVEEATGD
jgi:Putative beta-lactamase-inhibitor-like, PepSY-like